MKWEYMILHQADKKPESEKSTLTIINLLGEPYHSEEGSLIIKMNELGEKGWECFDTRVEVQYGGVGNYFFFKRAVKGD